MRSKSDKSQNDSIDLILRTYEVKLQQTFLHQINISQNLLKMNKTYCDYREN
jgi:hypothetical protein